MNGDFNKFWEEIKWDGVNEKKEANNRVKRQLVDQEEIFAKHNLING